MPIRDVLSASVKRRVHLFLNRWPSTRRVNVVLTSLSTKFGQNLTEPDALRKFHQLALKDFAGRGFTEVNYFEAGVYAGDSVITWCQERDRAGVGGLVVGADSFQGLPAGVENDEGTWQEGMFFCSKETTEQNIAKAGFSRDEVQLVEGWFSDSLTPLLASKIGSVQIAMLDADAYSSTVPVLEFLDGLVTVGTWIIFDDWFSGGNYSEETGQGIGEGVERAFNEWLATRPDLSFEDMGDYTLRETPAGKIVRLSAA